MLNVRSRYSGALFSSAMRETAVEMSFNMIALSSPVAFESKARGDLAHMPKVIATVCKGHPYKWIGGEYEYAAAISELAPGTARIVRKIREKQECRQIFQSAC